jgi:hypothetical protein
MPPSENSRKIPYYSDLRGIDWEKSDKRWAIPAEIAIRAIVVF